MGNGTIEETYEHRIKTVLAHTLKQLELWPRDGEALFDLLEKDHVLVALGNNLAADMLSWGGDEAFWFDKIFGK